MASSSPVSIEIKTETERVLFHHYEHEKAERKKLESLVRDLQSQVEELHRHLKHVQEQKTSAPTQPPINSNEEPPIPLEYETDEEDLARETEWVRQKSRKKRKLNTTLSPQQGSGSDQPPKGKTNVKKIPLPPPIVIENILEYQKLYDLLSSNVAKDSFVIKMLNAESVKVNANNDEAYRAITKLLSKENHLWHSYENKQDRPIRVMAKNLHLSCQPVRIIEDLILQGYKIHDAVNKLSWRSKTPLNMFMLSFHKEEDINKIYGIKSILGCKVDIQPIKSSKLIPQCKKCQAYGHTQKYCSKEPRCVKCTGKHLTIDCKKPAEAKPKCVHCGEAHPANYRGCIVAKELQTIRNKLSKKTNSAPATTAVPSATRSKLPSGNPSVRKNISYAQASKGPPSRPSTPSQPKHTSMDMDEKLNRILSLVTSFDERLKRVENSTKIAATKLQK